MRQVAEVGATVFFGHGHAVETEIDELVPQVGGEQVIVIDCGGARRNLIGREVLDSVAQHGYRFTEVKAHAGKVGHGGSSSGRSGGVIFSIVQRKLLTNLVKTLIEAMVRGFTRGRTPLFVSLRFAGNRRHHQLVPSRPAYT